MDDNLQNVVSSVLVDWCYDLLVLAVSKVFVGGLMLDVVCVQGVGVRRRIAALTPDEPPSQQLAVSMVNLASNLLSPTGEPMGRANLAMMTVRLFEVKDLYTAAIMLLEEAQKVWGDVWLLSGPGW